jgi:hypothetical protein
MMTARIEKKQKRRTIRDVSRDPPDQQLLGELQTLIENESSTHAEDRSTAISSAAFVEYFLELALQRKLKNTDTVTLRDFFQDIGPAGTFSQKIVLAYALGVIDKNARDDLDTIRRIRNAFAHTRTTARFETEEFAFECKKLRPGSHTPATPDGQKLFVLDHAQLLPRQLYLWTCFTISASIGAKAAFELSADLTEAVSQIRTLIEQTALSAKWSQQSIDRGQEYLRSLDKLLAQMDEKFHIIRDKVAAPSSTPKTHA